MEEFINQNTHREIRWVNGVKKERTQIFGFNGSENDILKFAQKWYKKWNKKIPSQIYYELIGLSLVWGCEIDEIFYEKIAYDLVLSKHDAPRIKLAIQRQGLDSRMIIWPKTDTLPQIYL